MIEQLHGQKKRIEMGNEQSSNDLVKQARREMGKKFEYDENKFHKDLVSGIFKDG